MTPQVLDDCISPTRTVRKDDVPNSRQHKLHVDTVSTDMEAEGTVIKDVTGT